MRTFVIEHNIVFKITLGIKVPAVAIKNDDKFCSIRKKLEEAKNLDALRQLDDKEQ
ncbi:transposase [Bacillus thuringiensis HD-771]|uniref:Transposase n=1 Tax=Bacillus thuringiensis HD-771 TaxID=1218175 RepID=A0A9W3J7Y2_BACTU|nr:transposase [Bacillus thuringiensis HD-771]